MLCFLYGRFLIALEKQDFLFKDIAIKIEELKINDCLHVEKVCWKFHIQTIYNFAVIHPWNFPISLKKNMLLFNICYFLLCKQNLRLQ